MNIYEIDFDNMTDEEIDEFYRPKKTNSRKSLAPLFIYLILKDESSSDKHLSHNDIAKKLSIHEFRVGKYMESVRNTDIQTIRSVISRCVDADAALKSSDGGYEILEKFVCTIPAGRQSRGY